MKIINSSAASAYGGNMYIASSKDIVCYSSYFEYGNKNNETSNLSIFRVLHGQFFPGFFKLSNFYNFNEI